MKNIGSHVCLLLFVFILLVSSFSGCLFEDQADLEYTFSVNVDGTADFSTINEAIAHAQDHDIIFVHNGLYEENLEINKSIHLIGENTFSTILDGNGEGTVISIIADGVKVTHFTICNSGSKSTYYEMDAGVNSNASNVQVSNCICTNNTDGLQVKKDGKTFFWSGKYHNDMNTRDTIATELNVLEDFNPVLPDSYKNTDYLMLGNFSPLIQRGVIEQMGKRPHLIVMDSMNFWIENMREEL
jgi:hypothetical protein